VAAPCFFWERGNMGEDAKEPKQPQLKTVTIKYGDVMVSVEGETQEQAKRDALEIFGFLEDKYSRHWEQKTGTEKTKYF